MEKVLKINVPEGYEVDEAKSTFESIVFRVLPDKLPERWEDLGYVRGYYTGRRSDIYGPMTLDVPDNNVRNTWPTREEAEASIALAQLLQLRDRYNGDWRPDWTPGEGIKWGIWTEGDNPCGMVTMYTRTPLCFKTEELRDKFLSCPEIRKLIEIAKPLL